MAVEKSLSVEQQQQKTVTPVEERLVVLELQVTQLRKFVDNLPALQQVIAAKNAEIVELSFENKRLNETITVYKERIAEMTAALETITMESK
jgi:peptidoglycan hydrolase CwlO-like protein